MVTGKGTEGDMELSSKKGERRATTRRGRSLGLMGGQGGLIFAEMSHSLGSSDDANVLREAPVLFRPSTALH